MKANTDFEIKGSIDNPRHQEDARTLRQIVEQQKTKTDESLEP